MNELELKYGCNPNQKPARVYTRSGELPFEVLNGRPGYINFLDALNSWQLVREAKRTLGLPSAASFKHVSPAGAALGIPLSGTEQRVFFTDADGINDSPMACAYVRARGTDRMSSFGDWIALSDTCDETTAKVIQHEVSDGIIAPDYTAGALEILRGKRKGAYAVIRMDPDYEPESAERRDVFGITFEQGRNDAPAAPSDVFEKPVTGDDEVPQDARRDMMLALIVLKYTQSNSVCCVRGGQTLGVGAGQQSRLHCTRLACDKTDARLLREHPRVLSLPFKSAISRPERDNAIDMFITASLAREDALAGWELNFTEAPKLLTPDEIRAWLAVTAPVSMGSDAFFPFPDSVERARRSGVRFVAQPGGSIRDDLVIESCRALGIAMVMTGQRLFHH